VNAPERRRAVAKKTSRKKTLIVIGIVCVVVLIVFVIIDSIVRYRAQMPGSRNFETFEKMKSELEYFDKYKDVLYPNLARMELEDIEWTLLYWNGRKTFKKTEPTNYLISGFQDRMGKRVHYSVNCSGKLDRFMTGEEYRGHKTLFEKMSSSTSNIYQIYFQHDGKEYMAEAAYEFEKMTEDEQRQMAELLRSDLERILFEMIDQAVK
jgi:hypothetical protein